ncbi:MAG: glycosyltransferase family 9 protein [Deltaproteobacteria bacterium]|nr:glycosyltransferase family 9 protein [Deltaproteobacteria bacterium]
MSADRPRALLVRLSSLGDVVLATAALEALREDVPGLEVHVLTKPSFREVFSGNPAVAQVKEWWPSQGVAATALGLRREGYDWVVDLHANLRTRLLRLALPGPRWSVYAKGSRRRRLAVALKRPQLLGTRHVVDRYLDALGPLGVRPFRRLPRLYPTDAEREAAARRLAQAGWRDGEPLLALAPGARWATKAWPPEHWAALLQGLSARRLGVPVLLGGAEEAPLCRGILEASGAPGVSLAGEATLRETTAILGAAAVLICNDSAPLHLAAAVRTPVVALFGPTVRGFGFSPLGARDRVLEIDLDCRPCSLHGTARCPRGHHRCLRDVAVDRVLDAAASVLLEAGPSLLQNDPFRPA